MSVKSAEARPLPYWLRLIGLIALLYVFMSAVGMMGGGFKLMEDVSRKLLGAVTENPVPALMMGVLATAIIQSSSVTTSIIVGLVGAGQITVRSAVPMVMGANIGTTITCSLVSLGYVTNRGRFQRAFSAATMHDFFNFATVALLLPLEIKTRFLSRAGEHIAGHFSAATHFTSPKSPIKAATALPAEFLKDFLTGTCKCAARPAAILMVAASLVILFISLYFLSRSLKGLVAGRMETVFDRFLFRTPLTALAVGLVFTVAVQSSSVTTSLMVPLVASGTLSRMQAFPYVMGAHVGTTVTAVLAALGLGETAGFAIAAVHTLYNLIGVAIFFPFARMRAIPVRLARALGALTLRSRWYALVYIVSVFFLLPALAIAILG